jgi:hypothetical protein
MNDYGSPKKTKYTVPQQDISYIQRRQPHELFGDFRVDDPNPRLVKDFLTILNKKSGEYKNLIKNIDDYFIYEKEIIKRNNEIKERNIKIRKSAPNFITGSRERHRSEIKYLESELPFLERKKINRFSVIDKYYNQYINYFKEKFKGGPPLTPGTIDDFIRNVVNVSGQIMPNQYYGGKSRKHRNKSRKHRNKSRKHRN